MPCLAGRGDALNNMNHIDGFFSKLKSAFASQANKKEIVTTTCLKYCKVPIQADQIEIHGPFIKLNVSPGAKSAIFMNKAAILAELKDKMKPVPLDIR